MEELKDCHCAPNYEAECKRLYEENIKLQRKVDGLIVAIQAITERGNTQ